MAEKAIEQDSKKPAEAQGKVKIMFGKIFVQKMLVLPFEA